MATMQDLISFFLDPVYLRILLVTVLAFAGVFLLWFMCIELSKRDLFTIDRVTAKESNVGKWIVYGLKYVFLFPLWTFMWFVLLVICIKVLSNKTDTGEIMFLAVILVSVVRIAAYVSEHLAEDIAKILPMGLLAGILLSPSFITLNIQAADILSLKDSILGFIKYLLFIIALEFVLKMGHAMWKRKSLYHQESD